MQEIRNKTVIAKREKLASKAPIATNLSANRLMKQTMSIHLGIRTNSKLLRKHSDTSLGWFADEADAKSRLV